MRDLFTKTKKLDEHMIDSDLLDVVACPICNSKIEYSDNLLKCSSCSYNTKIKDAKVDLIPKTGKNRLLEERFEYINESIENSFAQYSTLLTLGYVENENKQYSEFQLDKFCFNKYSTKLFFEIIGNFDFTGKKCAEIGCGRGGNIELINKYFNPDLCVGIDLSKVNIDFCLNRYNYNNSFFILGDAENIPMMENKFDVLINIESSHYYQNIDKFLMNAHRILKKGGRILYADILNSDKFEELDHIFHNLGFEIKRDQDISSNVLLACEEISKIREKYAHTKLYESFIVVPGSKIFEELRTGERQYKILTLEK